MKIIEKQDNKIIFSAEIDESLANSIRRYLNQISILAVDEVEISKNDSALYDETIAHRIGLVPLKMDKGITDKTELNLKLSVKKEGLVYSEELTGGVKVVYDKIPITTLKKGQELELVATAIVGKGSKHPKFSPGMMFYRNIINVKVNKDCPKEVVDVCPKNVFELGNEKVIVKNSSNCDMCEACTELCDKKEKKDAISLNPTNELIITLESWGQLPVEEILKRSIEELKKDLKEASKSISK